MSSMFGRDGHKYRAPELPVPPRGAPRHDGPGEPLPRRSGGLSFFASIAAILIWSVFAYAGYMVIDIGLGWLATSGDAVLASGRNVGTLVGADKEVGAIVDGVRSSGLLQQIVGLAQLLLIPVMLVIWFIGVLVLMLLPRIFGKIIRLASSGRR
ncbi:hypothetical protein [Rhizobium sp.]